MKFRERKEEKKNKEQLERLRILRWKGENVVGRGGFFGSRISKVLVMGSQGTNRREKKNFDREGDLGWIECAWKIYGGMIWGVDVDLGSWASG